MKDSFVFGKHTTQNHFALHSHLLHPILILFPLPSSIYPLHAHTDPKSLHFLNFIYFTHKLNIQIAVPGIPILLSMDAEDDEASLQPHSDAQCHTDMQNIPYAAAEVPEPDTVGELSAAAAVHEVAAVEPDATMEAAVESDEGVGAQVMDEVIEEKGDEVTDVDDVALEMENVEEEGNLAIDAEEDEIGDEDANEDALMEEEDYEQQQGEEEEEGEEEEKQQQGEEEEEGEEEEKQQQGVEEEEEEQQQGEEEEEEEEEEEQQQGEEAEEDADAGMAKTDDTEEKSVSGGKRKRGAGKNAKTTGRVASRKKTEEDVCFICFDGGDLVLCDRRGCPKAYHPSCVNRDEAFFRAKGKWNCGWHLCSNCERNANYMCYTCTFSLCKGCIKDAVILCVRGNKGFCETCMRTVMLIEQNVQGSNVGQVDFDDKNSWEYLFKDYYIDLKEKLSLTFDEISQAKNPWKGSDMLHSKEESPDELFDATNDRGSDSDSSYENDSNRPKRRKAKKRGKPRSKEGNSNGAVTVSGADGPSGDDSSEWASKELLEFVIHMRNGDKSVLSQFDVQALLLEYIKRNKLRDPRRKSQIICDARLQNLFGKPRVGHFEMLKLLESHFLLKEDSQAEDLQGSVVDTEVSHLEADGNPNSYTKAGKDKKRKNRKKGDDRGLQTNVDDYAAIDNHNINLIYLRRNLVEDLLEDTEKFHDKVVGAFVRIRISGSGQKQDLYRLVQVVGTCKAAEPYKVGKRMTDTLLEILNLNKTEIVSIDIISNQEFTEDECKRLRQSIKCGLINRLTVGDIQDKALVLQAVRVKDWLETEIVRLSHLRDRASEKGRRKELRECVEKLQLLKTPEERQRRLEEIPEIHVDPNMDPSYESEEDEDEMDDKRRENYMRPRGSTSFGRRGRDIASPRSVSISNESWSGTRNYSNTNQELGRNLSNKGFSIKGENASNVNEVLNDTHLLQGRDRESQLSNSWERQKLSSSLESGAKSTQSLVTSDSFSTAVLEASAAPSSAGITPSTLKINETEKMWHYQDPSGKIQGPFSMVQLRKWSNTGYFPADLRVWRTTEKQDDSILVTDALAGNFSKEPSMVDKAQKVHDLHYPASYSRKSAQGMEGQAGERPTFDQNSGSLNSHSTLGSPAQTTGGSWRSKDNMNSLASRPSPLAVEVPKNPANGWGSDAGSRNETTNLPSPTPQTTPGVSKGQAFENKWSPTPVQLPGSLVGNSFPSNHGGLQASLVVHPEHAVQNPEKGSSQPGISSVSSDNSRLHPHPAPVAPVLHSGLDLKMAGLPTPGFLGMNTPEPWRPPASSSQPNITGPSPAPPNMPWGMGMPGNQNMNWGGVVPAANMNANWIPTQGPAPGNSNPGWAAPSQGLPQVNAVGWVGPGQGRSHVNVNAGWVGPGQGVPPGNANPVWVPPAGNPGVWGSEQSHNGDRFPNQGDRGSQSRDSGYGGKSWNNRQSSFGRGAPSRPPFGGQRGVCKYHESGHCRKGDSCDFLHN
ncbi:zinc finger CCCH domain-containing protein 19-like isoform X2 [Vigna umbellata]|uniref:zinc finger CCCH domain-containing protein 19-like isoform X2 n=1 Tax=Vigna umbellata TaxID=87088 RepID=UPI001F5F7D02|nr:zinc finger CCCH domain-containing protein 19-like isoform X2 [Vigna umbellata]